MQSSATTPKAYLEELPEDRRKAIRAVRTMIRKYLPNGYKEVMQYGMISYVVPLRRYPDGYLGDKKTPLPFLSLASQKNYMSLYMSCIYTDKKRLREFEQAYKATGKRLDMGKSCVRFRTLEDLPLEVVGKTIAQVPVEKFIEGYEKGMQQRKAKK